MFAEIPTLFFYYFIKTFFKPNIVFIQTNLLSETQCELNVDSRKMSTFTILNFLLLAFFLLYANQIKASPFNENDESSRIVGGTVTNISRAKFVVNLRKKGKFICGGTLVAPTFVITAAHCVEGLKVADLSVVGGATYLSDKGIKRSVLKIVVPKEYNPENVDMDIAVLELSSNMKGANTSSIELCKSKWKTNDFITVYGWGQITENNDKSSNQLRTVSVPVIDQNKCSDMYKGHGKITRSMFCAGNLRSKDACTGDSGGPAIFKNQLCGVVSWGIGCARSKYPGVYTNIVFVKDFIDKTMYKSKN